MSVTYERKLGRDLGEDFGDNRSAFATLSFNDVILFTGRDSLFRCFVFSVFLIVTSSATSAFTHRHCFLLFANVSPDILW